MRSRIMESKGEGLNGPARIGRVTFNRTGLTLSYNGKSFRSLKGSGFKANFYEIETGEQYWISGPRRDWLDRLYGKSASCSLRVREGGTSSESEARLRFHLVNKPQNHAKSETTGYARTFRRAFDWRQRCRLH